MPKANIYKIIFSIIFSLALSINSFSKVKTVNEKNFKSKVIKGSKKGLVAVKFFSPTWGACTSIKPVWESISKKRKKISVFDYNIAENSNLYFKYACKGLPTIIFFKNGKEVDRYTGGTQEAVYLKIIDGLLKK